jgi:hypothetical protein
MAPKSLSEYQGSGSNSLCVLLLALSLSLAGSGSLLTAEEPMPSDTPPPKTGIVGLEDPAYGRIVADRNGVQVVGGAFVMSEGESLRADSIRYDTATGEVTAEGGVVMQAQGWTLLASKAVYNTKTGEGTLTSAEMFRSFERKPGTAGRLEQGQVDIVVVRAAVIRKTGKTFTAEKASVTSCGFYTPHYDIEADQVTVSAEGMLEIREARLRWGGLTLFHLSSIDIDPKELPNYLRPRAHLGNDALWGFTAEAGIGIPAHDGVPAQDILLNYRDRRGPGMFYEIAPFHTDSERTSRIRFGAVWEGQITAVEDADRAARILARRGSLIDGTPVYQPLDYYLFTQRRLADGPASPDMTPPLYADDFRYLLDFKDHIELSDYWNLDVSLYKQSDRDYAFEYDTQEYLRDWRNGSYVRLGGASPYVLYRIYTAFRTDDTVTVTEYLPEARIMTYPFDIMGGFLLNAEVRAGYLHRYFDPTIGLQGFEAFRTHTAVSVERPIYFNEGLALTPFVKVQSTDYSASRLDEPLTQSGMTAGATASFSATGHFGDETSGISHIIRGALTYTHTPRTTANPIDVYDFDEVDDFMAGERLTLLIDQRLRREGDEENSELARLILSGGMILDTAERLALADGSRWSPLLVDLLIRPVQPFEVFAALDGLPGKGVEDLHTGFSFKRKLWPGEDGLRTFGLAYRALAEDTAHLVLPTREIVTSLGYNAGRWGVDAEFAYELEDNALVQEGTILSKVVLTRNLHDIAVSLGASYDWADREYSFSLRLVTLGYTSSPVVRY